MIEFVMYHYVRDLKNSLFPRIKGLDIKEFIEQISFLKKNYNILSIEDFYYGNYNKGQKSCVLTFDDGYIDHYEFVFDILQKNKIKGSFFSPADTVLQNKILDVNKIHLILASENENKILERLKLHYKNFQLKDSLNSIIDTIDTSSRYDTKTTIIIKRLLQTILPFELRTQICELLMQDFLSFSESDLSKRLYMNVDQMTEMIDEGMHFGSHGKSHFWFSSLERRNQEIEIKSSIKFLESLYKKEFLLTICYPYGDYNNDTLSLLDKYNFKLGLTTVSRIFDETDNMLLIPRMDTNDYYPKNK
ncbi:MAG: polysaccharide deacetylase family protein [Flavobacteriaceae bacterium]|nr:polysaccharide deacetylase family protein [Flavobacteriaceae bacterium]